MTRAEKAAEYKKAMNCAQAVLMAFAPETGKSEQELMMLGSGFGMGMGTTEATCGALVGAGIALGLINKSEKPSKAIAAEVLREFQEKTGALACGDIKGVKTGKMLCACPDCCRYAAAALERQLGL